MLNKFFYFIFASSFTFLLASCGNGNSDQQTNASDATSQISSSKDTLKVDELTQFKYDKLISNIPIPFDILRVHAEVPLTYNPSSINPISNLGYYSSSSSKALNLGIYAGYWADKWINFWINLSANYNQSVSSIRPDVNTHYWSYNSYSEVQFKFKKQKFYWSFNTEFNLYQKTEVFANQSNVYILNSTVRKVITKDDKWEAKLYVNDIFNQNQGINRNISSNFISETKNQTIQRYFLLGLVYNFSKNGKAPTNGF